MVLKHASFVILYASGLDVLRGLVPQWLRTRYRLLFLLRVGAHFPLEQLWALSGVSWVLRGRLGEALGMLRGRLGEAFGSSWGLWGRLWVLRGRLREALECFQSISERLLGAPGTPWGASWGAFGTSWEAFWGSERALAAQKTQKWKSSFSLRNSLVFEVPVAPKASEHRARVASSGLVERAFY